MNPPLALALGLVVAEPATARAAEPPAWGPGEPTTSRLPGEIGESDGAAGDGAYGRFEGRFSFGASGGLETDAHASSAAARAFAHYFFTAGVYAGYAHALDETAPSRRVLSFGVDLQPAFIPRWAEDMQRGPGVLDLAVDSISLGLGAYFREPRGGDLGDARGFELSLGLGLPLAGRAAGPWLGARGLLRWEDPSATAPRAGAATGALLVTLGWQFVVDDAERAPEAP